MPLSEVDDELTRAIFKWQPTNSKAVKADMITVATKLGTVIAEEMGIVFGVMLQRYGAIRPQIQLVEAVEDLVPSAGDHKKLVGLLKHLEKLDSVYKRLQCEATTMSEIIQQGGVKRRQMERAVYSPLAALVPPTLNTCERFFSECKMILTLQRSCMLPAHFEMLMFLRANKDMWDVTSLA
ncbi:hypothetical protein JG687_00019172 [Phytophthora cactorum]|uniref:HAT C-terminal dimerisation domain-containing protein n=1 Tax=Phytophthora cactorum TaxID=29920 RepID=A0A8T1TMI5_9STRA|nr:hypothetical protein JG687_00019172 [Phytophthora cactorum]